MIKQIYTQRHQFTRDLWPMKDAESMDEKSLKYYQVLEVLGVKDGLWDAEI
jgi:hypothetical protein